MYRNNYGLALVSCAHRHSAFANTNSGSLPRLSGVNTNTFASHADMGAAAWLSFPRVYIHPTLSYIDSSSSMLSFSCTNIYTT
ncbi:hypothetical protein, partial [Escherichia coli]|uniref:hypothetical protein n=1 Tax=Escherichia coli TaxID=562 RepID=UPI00227EDC2F